MAVACPVLLLAHCSCPFFSSLTAYEVNWCALLAVFEQTGVTASEIVGVKQGHFIESCLGLLWHHCVNRWLPTV